MFDRRVSASSLHATVAGFLLVVVALLLPKEARAYPWMNRHDYNNCAVCHTDPSGGGILTAYGRAQSAILLSTRYGAQKDEEDPGAFKDFLFGVAPLPENVLLGAWVRNGFISASSGNVSDSRFLQMRADVAGQVKFGPVRVNGSIGYNRAESRGYAQSAWVTGESTSGNLVSREHWVGVDLADESILLRAGRINLPFGIRNVEHNLWVRSETRTDTNVGQQHGVAASYNTDKLRAEIMAIAGNFQLNPDAYRERGYSLFAEWNFNQSYQVGVSSLVAHASADLAMKRGVTRQAHGVFARLSPVRPLVVLAEANATINSMEIVGTKAGFVGYVQADYEPFQGIHLLATGETLKRPGMDTTDVGAWLSAWWFPLPHFDLRLDAIRRTNGDGPGVTLLLGQLHAYL